MSLLKIKRNNNFILKNKMFSSDFCFFFINEISTKVLLKIFGKDNVYHLKRFKTHFLFKINNYNYICYFKDFDLNKILLDLKENKIEDFQVVFKKNFLNNLHLEKILDVNSKFFFEFIYVYIFNIIFFIVYFLNLIVIIIKKIINIKQSN